MPASFLRRVGVVGLGYVGLPLATAFGRCLPTVGFDISERRTEELRKGLDRNGETPAEALVSPQLTFTSDAAALASCDVIVVAVPTPVDRAKRPDHSYLVSASRIVGGALALRQKELPDAPAAVVVFESTVYPGCTEEVCVPIIEESSGLRAKTGFRVGYSPERINPGDHEHTIEKIVKVVAGQDAETLEILAQLYGLVVKAGVYRAPDIRTAEAAKVIENTQRDLNIALMNELSIIFHRLGIDTNEVLKAAGTKWNFLPFKPGLVGGHCIPEDPYYLTYKAEAAGYHPYVILAGRRINDGMGRWIAQESVRLLIQRGRRVQGARALILGATFKEDVKDVRNTRVVDLVHELENFGVDVSVYDPLVGAEGVKALGLKPANVDFTSPPHADLVVIAVPHKVLRDIAPPKYVDMVRGGDGAGVIVDVKGILPRATIEAGGAAYWSL